MIGRLKATLFAHRNSVLFAAALACGGLAVLAGNGYLARQLEAERVRLTPKPPRTVDVIVARQDVAKGEVISASTMALRSIPADFASSSAIRPEQFEAFNGMRLATALRGGEQLVAGAIVGGEGLVFSHRVKPGIRALTIAVDEINSISGMLQPGDRIDLLFSARPPGDSTGAGQGPEATVPLFQGLLVLATGRQVRAGVDERGSQRSFSSVTVEVAPEHAQRLVVAQRSGKLTAVLRNPDDHQPVSRKTMDIRQLLDLPNAVAAVRQTPQVIIGGLGRVPAYPPGMDQPQPGHGDGQSGRPLPPGALPASAAPVSEAPLAPGGRVQALDAGEGHAPRERR